MVPTNGRATHGRAGRVRIGLGLMAAGAAATVATAGAARAQAPSPFAAPVASPAFSLTTAAGLLDVNRDGSADVIVPGLFVGTMLTTLDEHGRAVAVNGAGPGVASFTGATSPIVLALAGGCIDLDAREDLITVTSCGTVHFHRNLGATRVDRTEFAPDTLVDDFAAAFPIGPPFVHYAIPVAKVVDVDRDGFADVLVAGGPVDRWGASTRPGFVTIYRGDGQGGFTTIRHLLPGGAIDVEVADVDGDGTHDHLAVLTETGAIGAFAYEIVHLVLTNGALVPAGTPFPVGGGRFAALALADVLGDGSPDYLLAQTQPIGGGLTDGLVICYQGDGQGNPQASSWCTLALPAPTAAGAFVSSLQTGDWNRDGHVDVAVLRGYVQPPASPTGTAVHAASEVLIALGPALPYAPFTTAVLPGHHLFSSTWTAAFPQLPLFADPDALRPVDFGRDGSVDLLVSGLRTPGSPAPTALATLRNLTPPQAGDARFEKVGEATGGAPAHPARIGFDGGRPRPGNAAFACTIQNVRGGCLVGLLWGPVAIPGVIPVHGFEVHVVATHFGCGVLASGSAPGDGFASFPLPIPLDPALVGDAGYFQWVYHDHVAGALGGTQATGLSIGT